MRWIALILGLGWAAPLMAQDLAIDGHRIDRCIAVQDQMFCVGLEAQDYIDRNGSGADMVIAACRLAEADFWDGALNEAYGHLLHLAREKEAEDLGYDAGALTAALRDMQRGWIAYRDAACAHATALAKPFGTAAGPAFADCKMQETARQYFVLRDLRQDYLQ